MKWLVFSVIFLLDSTGVSGGEADWSYHDPSGPSTWSQHYPACNGSLQSPINIQHGDTTFDASLSEIRIRLEANISVKLLNDGTSVRAIFHSGTSSVQGGGLTSVYRAFQLHFHWGDVNSRGSEHQIDGSSSAMEIHIVHFNAEKYGNASAAITKSDGLLVLSVLVEVGVTTNPAMEVVMENLGNLTYNGSEISIISFPLALFLPREPSPFYRYPGSVTTPGCFESVKWFVFKNKMYISQRQIDGFRHLFEGGPLAKKTNRLVDNFRPVQPLNGRQVLRSFDHARPPVCDNLSDYRSVCTTFPGGKEVIYFVRIDPCTMPVTVSLSVDVPDVGFSHKNIYVSDLDTLQIGSLDCGVKMDLHSHPEGPKAGTLHLTLYQVHPLSSESRSEVMNQYFNIDGACKESISKCTSDSWDNQWCEKTIIGYDNDTVVIAYHLTVKDACGDTPSVSVKFYHQSSGNNWIWSYIHSFTDGERNTVHLTGHMLNRSPESMDAGQTRYRREISNSTWSSMDFLAKIKKYNNKVDFLLMLAPNGLRYTVLHTMFTYDVSMCSGTPSGLSQGSKIAIGITVGLVMAALIGLTVGCLYCKRNKYFGRSQTLIDEVEDSNINDNSL